MDKKQKILITGNLGFIGSHLHKLHPEADGYDKKHWDSENGIQDIRNELPKKKYTHIYHLAAARSVPLGEKFPQYFIDNNVWGTLNLARSYPDARILNISSSAAEAHTSVYGFSKFCTEHIAHKNWLNVRLYNVFGEGQPLESGAIIPVIFDCILRKKELNLYGDGKQTRDFSYVGDVAKTLKFLMFRPTTGTIDVCNSDPISVDMLTHICVSIAKKTLHINRIKSLREGDVLHSPTPKFTCFLNEYGRIEGLKRTWEWWKNGKGNL